MKYEFGIIGGIDTLAEAVKDKILEYKEDFPEVSSIKSITITKKETGTKMDLGVGSFCSSDYEIEIIY